MESWLHELRSPPGEGPFRGASRQVSAGFKLLRRDRTILALTLLGALALSGIWIGFFSLERETGPLGREADQVFQHLLYGAAFVGVSLLLSLAVACVADVRIDGTDGDARLLAAEVRRRLPALLCWWLISICAWVGLGLAADAVMRPLVAMLAVALVWGIATFFVVPTIAIEDCGAPRRPAGEPAAARRRLGPGAGRPPDARLLPLPHLGRRRVRDEGRRRSLPA
jgi:hypothetical protein